MNALVLDRDDIDLAAASWAMYAYTIADIDAFLLLTPNVAVLLSWLLDFCYRGFSSLSWQFDFAIVAFRSLSWLLPAIVAFSLMQSNDRSAKLY